MMQASSLRLTLFPRMPSLDADAAERIESHRKPNLFAEHDEQSRKKQIIDLSMLSPSKFADLQPKRW